MAEIGNIFVRIGAKIDDFEAAMRKVGDSIKKVEDRFSGLHEVGERLSGIGVKVAAAGAAIGAGFGLAVKTTADFEAAMSRVKALSGASEADFARLTETAKQLGATTAFSASQAAEGMQFLAMAGYKTNEIIAAMPGLLDAAAAGQTDLGRTADIVSNILSGFGLAASETGRVADVLTKAFTSSNTSLEMLGDTMKYVAPVAKGVGLSLEEVAAAAGLLGNAGIQASQAGTALRAIFLRLADPPKEAAEALKQLGVQVTDSSGKMRPLSEILADMKNGMEGMTEAQKAAIASTIAGTEASAALLALLDAGPETLANFAKELQNAGGTAEHIAEEQLNNLHGQLIILKSGLEGMAIAIGEALLPYLKRFTEAVQWLVDRFNSLPDPVKQGIAVFGALSAVVLVVGGTFLVLVGNIMQAIATIAKLGPLFTGLAAPIGVAIAAVTAFIAIGVALYRNWDEIKAFLQNTWDTIASTARTIWNGIASFLTTTWNGVASFLSGIWNGISTTASTIWNGIKSTITSLFESAKNSVISTANTIHGRISDIWNSLVSTIKSVGNKIWQAIIEPFNIAKEKVLSIVSEAYNWGRNLIGNIIDGIKSMISKVKSAVSNVASTIAGFLGFRSPAKKGPGAEADKWMPNLMEMLAKGIQQNIPKLQATLNMALATPIVESPTIAAMAVESPEPATVVERERPTMRPVEVHLHIGTLVADDYGLKQLERKLASIRISENMRLGVERA